MVFSVEFKSVFRKVSVKSVFRFVRWNHIYFVKSILPVDRKFKAARAFADMRTDRKLITVFLETFQV